MSLFDLNCKYADVIGADEVHAALAALPVREPFTAPR